MRKRTQFYWFINYSELASWANSHSCTLFRLSTKTEKNNLECFLYFHDIITNISWFVCEKLMSTYSIKQGNLINSKYSFELLSIWTAFTLATLVTTCNFPITWSNPIDLYSGHHFRGVDGMVENYFFPT